MSIPPQRLTEYLAEANPACFPPVTGYGTTSTILETVLVQRQVTLKDIARHCGVSVMAVSWALRGDRSHVSEATAKRILAAADQLGYSESTSHLARRLRYSGNAKQAPPNKIIALSFSWLHLNSHYFVRILQGIGEVIHREGFSLLTDWSLPDPEGGQPIPSVFARGEVDGAIFIEGTSASIVDILRAVPGFGQRPVVSLFQPLASGSSVLVDEFGGGRLLAEHLLEQGHRHLAYVEVGGWSHDERQRGYREAIRQAGLEPASHLRPCRFQHDHPLAADHMLEQLRAEHPEVTAILAGNDYLAMRLADACARLGWQIPDNLALAGFDDTHVLPDGLGGNRLTSVRYPLRQAGAQAAEMLIRQILDRNTQATSVLLPVELVPRASSACPKPQPQTTT